MIKKPNPIAGRKPVGARMNVRPAAALPQTKGSPFVSAGKPKLAAPGTAEQNKSHAKRPTGQFAGKRETTGKVNGGKMGEAMHPQSHNDFEKL